MLYFSIYLKALIQTLNLVLCLLVKSEEWSFLYPIKQMTLVADSVKINYSNLKKIF